MKAKILILLLMLLPIMASCGSDSEEQETYIKMTSETLVGTWSVTSVSGDAFGGFFKDMSLYFKSDGTCKCAHSMENSYKIENGRVHTYYQKTQEPIYVYTFLSVNNGKYNVKVQGTLDQSNKVMYITLEKAPDVIDLSDL